MSQGEFFLLCLGIVIFIVVIAALRNLSYEEGYREARNEEREKRRRREYLGYDPEKQ
jgi:hypothetical protein